MNFDEILKQLIDDTAGRSLWLFSPELALCVTIVGLLLVRLFKADRYCPTYWVALVGTLFGFFFAYIQFMYLKAGGAVEAESFAGRLFELMHLTSDSVEPVRTYFFTGLLVFDKFTVFFRLFLLLFLILVIALTVISGIPDNEDGPDFYTLLLGATVGMMLMASANNLLILFLGIEMASVPSYVMVGFLKGRRISSEAALKYVVYGAGIAGVMLYGISLLAGLLGTTDMSLIAVRLHDLFTSSSGEVVLDARSNPLLTVLLAVLMITVGIAFKLSLVPFHFWCPDAFEGAPAEVAGFLSVASKAAAFALLVRFCLALVGSDPGDMAKVYLNLGVALGIVAAASATFGNLAAYAQTNIKRLLAYSTIAHAGYMLMAVAAMMVLINAPDTAEINRKALAAGALEGLLYYLAVYLFMNLGAFAIVALIRNQIFSEEIEDYAGLGWESRCLGLGMAVCMFSLVGMPPFGGFFAKLMIFKSLVDAASIHPAMWVILAVGGLNTVFSLFYYLRVLKTMYITARPEGARPLKSEFLPVGAYVLMISAPVLMTGFFPIIPDRLSATANEVAQVLFSHF